MARDAAAARSGRPPAVTRRRIEAAILTMEGELTVPALADEMGVSVATLYRHVPGQAALLAIADEVTVRAFALPAAAEHPHWALWLEAYALGARERVARYPFLSRGEAVARPTPALIRTTQQAHAALVELGLDAEEAMIAWGHVSMLAVATGSLLGKYGRALAEAGHTTEDVLAAYLEEGHDRAKAAAAIGSPFGDPLFESMLRMVIEGLARRFGRPLPRAAGPDADG